MDLFSCLGKEYLITVDYYFDFWELDLLPANPTAASVITKCKINFSRHGIPKKVVSDNGSQFVSEEFANFAKEWEFSHKPTSPYHSRSNAKAEAAVKIVKTMLKKAHRDKKDPWLAILDWRSTPTEQIGTSPVQRLMSRRTCTRLPTADELLNPEVVNGVTQKIEKKRKKAKFYFDRTAEKLPELVIDDHVRLEPLPNDRDRAWKSGTCISKVGPQSYLVDCEGTVRRCNMKFISSTNEKSWCYDLEIPESTSHENEGRERPERPFIEGNTEEGGYLERESRKETAEKPNVEMKNSKVGTETVQKPSQERKASDVASQDSGLKCTRTRVIKPLRRCCEE